MGRAAENLYQGFEGMWAAEISRAPELFVQARHLRAKGVALPLGKVPDDLTLPASDTPIQEWATFGPFRGWGRRKPAPNRNIILTDDMLQFAQNPSAAERSMVPTFESVVPGGLYAVRLTEQGRSDILPAALIQNALFGQLGRPEGQFRFIYALESGQTRVDWIGLFRRSGGQTSRGPIISR